MKGHFTIFTLNTWNDWENSGKANVVQKIKHFIAESGKDATVSLPEQKEDLFLVLYEVVMAVVLGLLERDKVKPLLSELLPWHPELGSVLVEAIFLVELETTTLDNLTKNRQLLLGLIRAVNLEKLYKERLDIDTLGDADVIKNKKAFLTKQIRVRTKMYYKQQKYNLLREESEGYAKLITELNQEISDNVTPSSIIQVIRSLIGTFNLDPNRVLDLILEAYEQRPEEKEFYNDLLHLFPHESATISEILGFKLKLLKLTTPQTNPEANQLFIVIALLIQAGVLRLSDIYEWLTPDDDSMIAEWNSEVASAKDFASKANVISTKDKETEKEKDNKDKDKETDKDKNEAKQIQKNIQFNNNQKIQLAIALLNIGDWDHFMEICGKFPENYIVSRHPVSVALSSLILQIIEPYYRRVSKLPARIVRRSLKPSKGYLTAPIVDSVDSFSSVVFPMLTTLGPYISCDLALMYKILRIAKFNLPSASSKKDSVATKSAFYFDFLTALDECLLPALSMFESNPCVSEEVWEAIKGYPYQIRYKLYSRWKDDTFLQHPELIKSRTTLLKKAKYTMMRITKETIKPVSRNIGKQTHNSPGPVLEYILKQVQLYDNLIGPVVDSLKYLSSLSYDVLGYCIVEILSLSKDRTQNEAMAISPWFQSLSGFCGSVCKKYSLDLGGILQFVANQLKSENSIDLLLLKDIAQKMGGTDSIENLTPDQLDAMCGGEHLKREAGQYLQEKNTKRSSARLKEALMENNLGIPLLLLMAQQRASIVYNQAEEQHLKLVGKLYDQCQDTLLQFGSYLFQNTTIDELNAKVPPIGSLLTDYHLNADIAFFYSRPLFNHMLQNKYDEMRKRDKMGKKLQLTPEDKKRIYSEAICDVFAPLIQSIRPHYSTKIWEDMDPSFFLTFWLLTMSDLDVPTRIYDKEIKKLTDTPTAKMRKREIERLQSLKEKLEEEKKRQLEHKDRVSSWLTDKCDTWFSHRNARSLNSVTTFLQLCVFPRCTFSTLDAVYCARFVRMLHNLKTPNFSTLLCYDKMYCDITYTVTSCTEQEAHHYARFLLGTLETVMHWHKSADNFDKECAKYPGFITRFRISTKESNDYVDYENFRHVVHKWHFKITKALVTCLESGDYIQIKNAILVLQGILPQFPAILNLAPVIEKRIAQVIKEEKNKRNDLFVLANSYSGRLKAKKPSLIAESKFHLVRKPDPSQQTKASAAAANCKPDGNKTKETNGMVNGEAMDVDDKTKATKRTASKVEEDDKKKKEKKKEEKDTKRKRDSKRGKDDESSTDGDADEGVAANGSGKMDPPLDSGNRTSKRKKPDHETAKHQRKDERNRSISPQVKSVESSSPKESRKDKKRISSKSPEPTKKNRKSQRGA